MFNVLHEKVKIIAECQVS